MKEHYLGWKSNLGRLTMELMAASGRVELSAYNEEGYFHHVPGTGHFEEMRAFWEREGRVPEEWVGKGRWPGIWTAMFHPCNTYSMAHEPVHVVRFYFKDGYYVYDGGNTGHRRLWKGWSGWGAENRWRALKNDEGSSLEGRMRNHGLPSHKWFYESNRFGAALGYEDYVSPVIVLESCVSDVEFL
ncbi:MAG: hypothetical protein ABII09_00595 [Planctomycetota bacterium]